MKLFIHFPIIVKLPDECNLHMYVIKCNKASCVQDNVPNMYVFMNKKVSDFSLSVSRGCTCMHVLMSEWGKMLTLFYAKYAMWIFFYY